MKSRLMLASEPKQPGGGNFSTENTWEFSYSDSHSHSNFKLDLNIILRIISYIFFFLVHYKMQIHWTDSNDLRVQNEDYFDGEMILWILIQFFPKFCVVGGRRGENLVQTPIPGAQIKASSEGEEERERQEANWDGFYGYYVLFGLHFPWHRATNFQIPVCC